MQCAEWLLQNFAKGDGLVLRPDWRQQNRLPRNQSIAHQPTEAFDESFLRYAFQSALDRVEPVRTISEHGEHHQ